MQVDNIQSQNFTRGTEGGTLTQEVGDELVRLMAKVRDLEATVEILKTYFTSIFCSVQNLQQGSNLMGEEIRNHQSGIQNVQRIILTVQDEVPRLRSRLQASEEAMGLVQDVNKTVGLILENLLDCRIYRRAPEIFKHRWRGNFKT